MFSRIVQQNCINTVRRAGVQTRTLASVSSSTTFNPTSVGPYQVFDRKAKQLQKDRAALREDGARSQLVDYVRDEVADTLFERLLVSFLDVVHFASRITRAVGY